MNGEIKREAVERAARVITALYLYLMYLEDQLDNTDLTDIMTAPELGNLVAERIRNKMLTVRGTLGHPLAVVEELEDALGPKQEPPPIKLEA